MNEITESPPILTRERIAVLVEGLVKYEQTECPLKHYFAPGVYVREIFMPKDTIVIGKIHKTEHFNIIQQGRVRIVHSDLKEETLIAPVTFVSKAGVQKVLYIEEDTTWSTVHITNETNLESLEAALIEPHDSYPQIEREAERLAIEYAAREVRNI